VYLQNWYEEMDMVCWSPTTISILGAAYHFGYGAGGIFFPLPEALGRRKTLLLTSWLFAIGPTIAIFG
jgi:hypothetical protein